jgi:hypothetical protein
VCGPCLEDGARVDVEDLHLASVITGDEDTAILPDVTTVGDITEAGDGLEELAGAVGVDLDARAGGDGEGVGVVGDVGDRIAGDCRLTHEGATGHGKGSSHHTW